MRRDQKGFTLMELMVVIVIVAILAAVAVPLYINYVQDAQRTEARGAIGAIITGQQAYYQKMGGSTYAGSLDDLGYPTPTATNPQLVDVSEADVNWDFAILNAGQNGYTVEAEGTTPQNNRLGVRYTYTQTGGGRFDDYTPGAAP